MKASLRVSCVLEDPGIPAFEHSGVSEGTNARAEIMNHTSFLGIGILGCVKTATFNPRFSAISFEIETNRTKIH